MCMPCLLPSNYSPMYGTFICTRYWAMIRLRICLTADPSLVHLASLLSIIRHFPIQCTQCWGMCALKPVQSQWILEQFLWQRSPKTRQLRNGSCRMTTLVHKRASSVWNLVKALDQLPFVVVSFSYFMLVEKWSSAMLKISARLTISIAFEC